MAKTRFASVTIGEKTYLARGIVRLYGNSPGAAALWAQDINRYIFTGGPDKTWADGQFEPNELRWTLLPEEPSGEYETDPALLEEALDLHALRAKYRAQYTKELLAGGVFKPGTVARQVAETTKDYQTKAWYLARLGAS
jgi:hypothetical protein